MSEPADSPEVQQRLLRALDEAAARIEELESGRAEPIAVIGLGCRLPGAARDAASFWQLLRAGVDAIGEVPADRWDVAATFDPTPDSPGKSCTRSGGFLDEVDRFDAAFFGISPREAAAMDPQQRLLLEVAHEALDGAGQLGDRLAENTTGVFVGLTQGDYGHLLRQAATHRPLDQYFVTGNSPNAAAGRISYLLGLRGPSLVVDTACSSSLVAIHLACQSLRAGDCGMALAGGVNLILAPEASIALSRARMLSADGRCKTFSAEADGYGRGEGCGLVVLKRLADARRAGDRILAVVRSSVVNQDGATGGFTVPSGAAQRALLRAALAQAQLAPAEVDYVEAHGTGTALGDPIEINALADAYGPGRAADRPLAVGSVKTNLGHLESAAGAAGFIKAVLALWHGEIPAHLHCALPNPRIAWADIPVKVAVERAAWPDVGRPRRAAVSAFGVSGTNAHIILEQAAPAEAATALPAPQRRFRGERHWFEAAAARTDEWDYEVTWPERPLRPVPMWPPLAVSQLACAGIRPGDAPTAARPGGLDYSRVLEPLEALARAYARKAVQEFGDAEIAPGRRRLWARVQSLAAAGGAAGEADPAAEAALLLAACPAAQIEITLLARCGGRLADVLRGTCEPLGLLFPQGGTITAASLYRDAPAARFMNERLAAAVPTATGRPLRVLEIGAGTGATTAAVLAGLPQGTEYVFTDVSPLFVAQARQRFADRPDIRFATLDLERDPSAQGFALGGFDLVLAANVVHATRHVRASLRHARSLLAPGGRLVLLEATAALGFLDLIFGLTEGWWRFADTDLRPDHPLLSAKEWTRTLAAAGFSSPEAWSPAEEGPIFAAQTVLAATRQDEAGAWLILADASGPGAGVASELAKALGQAGQTCRLAQAGRPVDSAGLGPWTWDPSEPADFRRLLETETSWRGIVSLEGLDAADPIADRPLRGALILAQALAARPARLWLATRGAVAAAAGESVPALGAASLWGFARSLAQEHPELEAVRVDLDPAADSGAAAAALVGELLRPDGEDQVVWRAGARKVARLVRAPASRPEPAFFRAEATYLVIGGLGGLGQSLARWMVSRGARHLVLTGRSAPGAAARTLVRELAAAGADLRLEQADAAAEADTVRVLAGIGASPWPLGGLVHAAGTLDDGVVGQLTWDRCARVLAPKVAGAWHLHRLTKEKPLDFFILFSSATALLGSPGQASHAAANAFLDALAHHRRALGLPALSLDWGAWAEIGAAAAPALAGRFRARGIGAIQPAAGWRALERWLGSPAAQVAVLPIDWSAVPAELVKSPFFSELRPAPAAAAEALSTAAAWGSLPAPERALRFTGEIQKQVAQILGLEGPSRVDPGRGFFTLGMDSLTSLELRNRLQSALGRTLPTTVVFDYPTAAALGAHLADMDAAVQSRESAGPEPLEPIAIVGLGLRYPGGADSPETLRALLLGHVDAVSDAPADRWSLGEFYDPDPAARGKMYARAGGFLGAVDQFDAAFFGVSPREAIALDPQQRLLLEVSWEALEHAGIAPDALAGSRTGVFVGISNHDYAERLLAAGPAEIDSYVGSGNAHSVAAGRLSYTLGLQGPSLAIDTACSSSLVAVHLACQSLRAGECAVALAAGVNLLLSPTISINHSRARMLAPDGRCKTFDAAADGFGRSEGCGVVVLKGLAAALRDGDRVLALVRGSAVNQDGRTSGLTVPSGPAQQAVIRAALSQAGAAPAEVGYVEAHGTGTALGDPIEAAALAAVFGPGRAADRPLHVGSIKTNIGHSESAAGVAGLIKAVLAVSHGEIPAHLHFRRPNPLIPWLDLPWLVVPTQTVPWPGGRRLAGVSSFGFGGTNAHVVVGEAPPAVPPASSAPGDDFLVLSARTEPALRELASRYRERVSAQPSEWPDICHTAAVGRSHFSHRLAIEARNGPEAADKLAAWLRHQPATGVWAGGPGGAASGDGLGASDQAAGPMSWNDAGRAWALGSAVDWRALRRGRERPRVSLPTYPFQRRRYWCNEPSAVSLPPAYAITWERAVPGGAARAVPSGGGAWQLVGGSAELRVGLAQALAQQGRTSTAEFSPRTAGVVFLADDLGAAETAPAACERLRMLVQEHLAARSEARIWIVTRGGAAVTPEDGRDLSLAAAPLWGFGKVLALEHPDLFGGLVDLASAGSPDECARLAATLLTAGGEDQLALRGDTFWAPRLQPQALAPGVVPVHSGGTYLVTGGTGALGLRMAAWLAAMGARHLVLLSRRPPAGTAAAEIERLRAAGIRVVSACMDVADVGAVRALVAGLPKLRGVVHAAGVPGYAPLARLRADELAAVLRPKVGGAWALHEATAGRELDFFVLVSSIASAWGSKGQAHYAAANQFLDGLAHHRRARGQPALSINWGPWAGGGMATEEVQRVLERAGIALLDPEEAVAALGSALAGGATQLVVARVDWERFRAVWATRGPRPLLSRLGGEEQGSPSPNRPSRWTAAAGGEPLELLRGLVGSVVARVLRLPEGERPPPRQGFTELGVDSLLALEIRNQLAAELGLTLPATLVFDHPEIERLARFLAGQLGSVPAAPALAAPAAETARRNLIAEMTEDEAEAALLQKLREL